MSDLRICSLITVFFSLHGCANWPPPGQGGMAGHHLETLSPVMPDQPLGPEHGLHFELELAQRHLDILVLEGAELCFPATVVQARQQQNRISRELHGGLDFDAATDLIVQNKLLTRLERQLDYVKRHNICELPVVANLQTPGEIGKRIFDLLNSDNQFAFDSAELNPKFIIRLAQAAQMLNKLPGYQLLITGHADALGETQHNLKLSLARAQKVGRYLQVLGLPANRMQFDAFGSDNPLFNGNEPELRLVNRRVSIELIEATGLSEKAAE